MNTKNFFTAFFLFFLFFCFSHDTIMGEEIFNKEKWAAARNKAVGSDKIVLMPMLQL